MTRKPQQLINKAKKAQPWDFPATCEICHTPQECFEGIYPCDLSGEFIESDYADDLLKRLESEHAKHVPIYCEAAQEIRNLHQKLRSVSVILRSTNTMLWCCVMAAGGEIRVPMSIFERCTEKSVMTETTDGIYMVYRATDGDKPK